MHTGGNRHGRSHAFEQGHNDEGTLDAILSRKNKGIFVVDAQHHLEGIVSVSDLTNLWTADEVALEDLMSRVPLANIIKTTRASPLHEAPFHPNGKVHLMPSLGQNSNIEAGTIVIVGNNPEVQRSAIRQKASLILICGENWVDSITLEMAKAEQVSILHTRSAQSLWLSIFKVPASRSRDPRSRRLPHQRNGGRSQSAHCQNTLPYLSGRQ